VAIGLVAAPKGGVVMSNITVTIGDKQIKVGKGSLAKELIGTILHVAPIMGVTVNNVVQDLNYELQEDCIIEFIDLSSSLGIKIYEKSLLFVLIKAAKIVLPDEELLIEHSLGGGIYCEFVNNKRLKKYELDQIYSKIKQIIQDDLPLNKQVYSKEEASRKLENKICLFNYVSGDDITLYELGGLCEYFHGYMLPSTGYLDVFDLRFYYPGFILLYPRSNKEVEKIEFVDQKKLFHVFSEYDKWCKMLDVYDVTSLNKKVADNQIFDLIRVAEAKHEKQMNNIVTELSINRESTKLIILAGPSSAGKTTTSKRLRTNLMVNGLKPVTIELDNYFLDREKTPKDSKGQFDFDCIEALDIELFNENLLQLMEYREVEIPKFNFLTGKREKGYKIKISKDNPIIIEGIHGLNERLTHYIPKENKYKIYINALTQLNIDSYNRIPTTDIRLIRRLVRDHRTRGHNAEGTLKMWDCVRAGEEKNIFPYGEDADYIFNSALFYELSVLKKYAEPILEEINDDSLYYPHAQRILQFLDLFLSIEDESSILANSILREFIGGSIY